MYSILAIDTTPITTAIADLSTAGLAVIAAAIAVAVGFFGLPFLWKKGKKVLGS